MIGLIMIKDRLGYVESVIRFREEEQSHFNLIIGNKYGY